MAKRKQALTTEGNCPNCGSPGSEKQPKMYVCPRCYAEGYECCFPAGVATVCIQCEEEEANEQD